MANNSYTFSEVAEDMHAGAAEFEAQQELAQGEARTQAFFAEVDESDDLP
jgi:hypothetical protein